MAYSRAVVEEDEEEKGEGERKEEEGRNVYLSLGLCSVLGLSG